MAGSYWIGTQRSRLSVEAEKSQGIYYMFWHESLTFDMRPHQQFFVQNRLVVSGHVVGCLANSRSAQLLLHTHTHRLSTIRNSELIFHQTNISHPKENKQSAEFTSSEAANKSGAGVRLQ